MTERGPLSERPRRTRFGSALITLSVLFVLTCPPAACAGDRETPQECAERILEILRDDDVTRFEANVDHQGMFERALRGYSVHKDLRHFLASSYRKHSLQEAAYRTFAIDDRRVRLSRVEELITDRKKARRRKRKGLPTEWKAVYRLFHEDQVDFVEILIETESGRPPIKLTFRASRMAFSLN